MNNKNKLIKIAKLLINDELSEDQKLEQIKVISLKSHTIRNKKQNQIYKYTIQEIESQICELSGKDIEYIKSASGKECKWRMMAFYKSVKFTKESQTFISEYFGNRGRTMVSKSKYYIENYLETDRQFRRLYFDFLNN